MPILIIRIPQLITAIAKYKKCHVGKKTEEDALLQLSSFQEPNEE